MNAPDRSRTHRDAWSFLTDVLQPDIALLQETVIPEEGMPGYSHTFTRAWDGMAWGSAVLSRVGDMQPRWEADRLGAVLVVDLSIRGIGPLSVASIHARIIDRRVIPSLRTTLNELMKHLSSSFIVGGDLNTARAAGKAWPRNGHREFWNEIEATWGFHEPLPAGGHERQSYWREWLRNKPPTIGNSLQDDHVFLDAETFAYPWKCRIWDTRQVREMSDHGPVVLDVELPIASDLLKG